MLQGSTQSVQRADSAAIPEIAAIVPRELTRTPPPHPGPAILELDGLMLEQLLRAGREAEK